MGEASERVGLSPAKEISSMGSRKMIVFVPFTADSFGQYKRALSPIPGSAHCGGGGAARKSGWRGASKSENAEGGYACMACIA